jgi:hypothetical protein
MKNQSKHAAELSTSQSENDLDEFVLNFSRRDECVIRQKLAVIADHEYRQAETEVDGQVQDSIHIRATNYCAMYCALTPSGKNKIPLSGQNGIPPSTSQV